MNVVRIIGGMGNQITQYAFGLALMHSGKPVMFNLDWFRTKGAKHPKFPRPFRLNKFEIPAFPIGAIVPDNPTIDESKVGYNPMILQMKNDNNYSGYWQYYSYYIHVLPILRTHLQVQSQFYTEGFLKWVEKIMGTDSVSLHVRRGDYLMGRKGQYKNLDTEYYFDAIREAKGDLFIFSDDLKWCRQTFSQKYFARKVYFVNEPDFLSFELMKFCKQHIISNSTFSFWAALLNDTPEKKVWCPTHYLGDTAEYSDTYRWPKDWIKLEDYKKDGI